MRAFADSNVLLYAISNKPADADKRAIARRLIEEHRCVVSVQVLNEFVWQATSARRGFGLSAASAQALTEAWCKGTVQALDVAVFGRAWDVSARTNYAWWDCLIVAAADRCGDATSFSRTTCSTAMSSMVCGSRTRFVTWAEPVPTMFP